MLSLLIKRSICEFIIILAIIRYFFSRTLELGCYVIAMNHRFIEFILQTLIFFLVFKYHLIISKSINLILGLLCTLLKLIPFILL